METTTINKEIYAKSLCMFLAELLQTRKINLSRSADIAQKVLDNLNLVDNEYHFLSLIKSLSDDFEELQPMQYKISFEIEKNERRNLEDIVRAYAVSLLPQDAELAKKVLSEASVENATLEDLEKKFPDITKFSKDYEKGSNKQLDIRFSDLSSRLA